jgi:hypothetical protein
VKNASSTPMLLFALVSRNLIPYSSSHKKRKNTSQRLALLFCHDFLLQHVALVAHEDLVDALGRMLLNITNPVSDVIEASVVRHVVGQEDAHGAAVVGRRNRSESFLTSRILFILILKKPRFAA